MTEAERAEIRARDAGATPGPWIRSGVRQKLRDEDCIMVGPDGFLILAIPYGRHPKDHAGAFRDAEFIARAREDIPRLLDTLTASESARLALVAQLDEKDAEIARLRELLTGAYSHVLSQNRAEHMLDGFAGVNAKGEPVGRRSQQPTDALLAEIEAALASQAPASEEDGP